VDHGPSPNRRLSGFFTEKNGFVGTVLSIRSGLWTSNMPKMRWRDPAGGAHDAPPDSLVGWGGGHPLPNPHLYQRLDSRAFGIQLLRHQCKIWLRPFQSWAFSNFLGVLLGLHPRRKIVFKAGGRRAWPGLSSA